MILPLLVAFTSANPVEAGLALPPATFLLDSGERVQLDIKKPTWITFVGFWCNTWKYQWKSLKEAHRLLEGEDVDWVVVSVDGRWKELKTPLPFATVYYDLKGAWTQEHGIDRVPMSLLVNKDGIVSWMQKGTLRPTTIVDMYKKRL